MRIDPDTPVSELMHSDELMHHKYVKRERLANGKYRYWYDESTENDTLPPGQNYTTPNDTSKKSSAKKKKEEKNDPLTFFKKADRYIEAAKAWLDSRLNATVADTISGKAKFKSWQQAKEYVDHRYRDGDPDLFLTDKYRK